MDDFQHILENGINFGRGGDKPKDSGKVKTKAKKKQYNREQRANRHKK